MLSKISKRSRRRSEQDYTVGVKESLSSVVDRAPDLVRWCDLSTPFPSVALGGYTKYYSHVGVTQKIVEAPRYCPALSQDPFRSSPIDTPRKSSLFHVSASPPRALAIIKESSMESTHPRRPPALTVSTNAAPNSLRRQRRRLLRTPSIERDFAVHGRKFFSSSISVDATSESGGTSCSPPHSAHSPSSTSAHSDSTHSESSHFAFSISELPLTPSTSIDSDDHFEGMLDRSKSSDCLEEMFERPGSSASFNTAKTGFSDA